MPEAQPMKSIGCANGWSKVPAEIEKCKELAKTEEGHGKIHNNLGRCYNEYGCEICGFTYTVDSSD
jgi:hypothetical protein